MLSEYYLSIQDFDLVTKDCAKELAKFNGIDHIQRMKMSALAQDMVSFSENLARAHINATMWMLDHAHEVNQNVPTDMPNWEDMEAYLTGKRKLDPDVESAVKKHIEDGHKRVERMVRISKSKANQRSEEATWELKACYKAYVFFIRAFHDACYGVLLNINGMTPGAYSSMHKCIRNQVTPIFEKISDIPSYVEWFLSFKKQRDIIKQGVGFSLCGPQSNIGVSFNQATPDGGIRVDVSENGNKIRLGDIINAIKYSSVITELILQEVTQSNDLA